MANGIRPQRSVPGAGRRACQSKGKCAVGKAIRIPLADHRRVFTPVARSSYLWQDYYDQRSALERVNSRLPGSFGLSGCG